MIWRNAAHTFDGPHIFRKRKNVMCANFCTDLFAKISTGEFFEMLVPFLIRKLSGIAEFCINYITVNFFERCVEIVEL